MNNLSFSNKFSPQHDNGERILCWRKYDSKETIPEGIYLATVELKTSVVVEKVYYTFLKKFAFEDGTLVAEPIIAYMKLPTPYKPD